MDKLPGQYLLGYLPDSLEFHKISRDGEQFRIIKTFTENVKNWLSSLRQIYFYREDQEKINELDKDIGKADAFYSKMIYGSEKERDFYECYNILKEYRDSIFEKWALIVEPPSS